MREFIFEPAYYEWHLKDRVTGEILHNMCDPSECFFDENTGEPITLEELKQLCADDLHAAEWRYMNGEDYNGIYISESLTEPEIMAAADIMSETLYNYYIK